MITRPSPSGSWFATSARAAWTPLFTLALGTSLLAAGACHDENPTAPSDAVPGPRHGDGTARDPINVLSPGTDIRWVRTALMMLDGDRSAGAKGTLALHSGSGEPTPPMGASSSISHWFWTMW